MAHCRSHAARPATSRAFVALALVALVAVAAPPVAVAEGGGAAHVPLAQEINQLLAGNLAGYAASASAAANAGWDASAGYDATFQGEAPAFQLVVSASVLPSVDRAVEVFGAEAQRLEAGASKVLPAGPGETAAAYGLDDLRSFRLIVGPASGPARTSTYARLLRLGRAVALIEARGGAEADDAGRVDNDRALALVRTFELVLGRMFWYPADTARPVSGIEPLTVPWSRHGFGLTVDGTGHGQVSWRVNRWCADDPTPPCDDMTGNVITNGGSASIMFYRADGTTAQGVVIGSNDDAQLSLGPVSLTLRPYGMAHLVITGRASAPEQAIDLCGPDFPQLAPDSVRREMPCGA